MNKVKWEKEYEDIACYRDDANDFYYEWVDFEKNDLVDLFEKWLGVGIGKDIKVKIKVKEGAIFILRLKEQSNKTEGSKLRKGRSYEFKRMQRNKLAYLYL